MEEKCGNIKNRYKYKFEIKCVTMTIYAKRIKRSSFVDKWASRAVHESRLLRIRFERSEANVASIE